MKSSEQLRLHASKPSAHGRCQCKLDKSYDLPGFVREGKQTSEGKMGLTEREG